MLPQGLARIPCDPTVSDSSPMGQAVNKCRSSGKSLERKQGMAARAEHWNGMSKAQSLMEILMQKDRQWIIEIGYHE